MNELINKLSADTIVQDIFLILIFWCAFTVLQFVVDQVHKPYLNFENELYAVYLFIPARNGSRYHRFCFARRENGSFSYVSDRLHPKYFLIAAAVLFVAYLILRILKEPFMILYVHGALLLFLILSIAFVFHPVRALIYLKRHSD